MPLPKRSYEFLTGQDLEAFEFFFKSRENAFKNNRPLRTYEEFFKGYFEENEKINHGPLDDSAEEELNFLVEIDLKIPQHLHHYLEDYPLPASKYVIR